MITNFLIHKYAKVNNESDFDSEDLSARRRLGMLSGIVGIVCNIILSFSKFFAGIITSSIAISADAFNNLSDAISSIVTLICFKTSGSPADKDHPFGYGRIEYVSGLIVSIAIIFMGIEFTKSSVEKLFNPEPVTSGIIPIIILIISMIIKLWLGNFNNKIGNIINSTAMKATAFDSLGDAIITLTILVGMIITYFTKISIDAYLGIGVALFIIFTGISMIKETLSPLLGQSPNPEFVKKIYKTVEEFPEILGIHDLTVHNYGPGRSFISFHAEINAKRNIMEVHDEIDMLEKKLKDKFKCQAIIHMDPIVTDDKIVKDMREKLSGLVKLISEDTRIYDLRIVPGVSPTLIFQVCVPYTVTKTDFEICKAIKQSLNKIEPEYECIIDVTRNYFDNLNDEKESSEKDA